MPATTIKATQKATIWKLKNAQKQLRIKQLATRITQLTNSRQHWRTKYYQLKKSQQPQPPKHHPYCIKLMSLSVILHIHHNLSLRACSAALYEVAQLYGQTIKRVSATTIRAWSRRMGHYYLQMQLEAGSYVLIADESVLVGQQKLLVILAVRQENLCRLAPLTMADVSVIHVQPASSWKGADIAHIIQQKSQSPDVSFAYAISDKGYNLRKAFSLCGLPWVEDITHRIATQTRLLIGKDAAFNAFIARQQLTRAKWALSQYAPYLPPNVRKKARFHQLLVSADWAQRVLANWFSLPVDVQAELHYVLDNESLVQFLGQLQVVVGRFSSLVKARGISAHTRACWAQGRRELEAAWQARGWSVSEGMVLFLAGLDAYLLAGQESVKGASQVLCCSDVIESMFGKYKHGLGQPVISDESVKIAAFGRQIGLEQVRDALGCISHQFLREAEAGQSPSLTKLRRKALPKNDLKIPPTL